MADLKDTVYLLVIQNDKVLLVRNSKAKRRQINLPGGRIRRDKEESEIEAGVRLLKAKTGLRVKKSDFIPLPAAFPSSSVLKVVGKKGKKRVASPRVYLIVSTQGELLSTKDLVPYWWGIEELDYLQNRTRPFVLPAVQMGVQFQLTQRHFV